jgi:hypothetical protein
MPIKVKLSRELQKLLSSSDNGLVPSIRKEFSKRGPTKVKQAIVQDMIKGVSPVRGGGKWKRYSNSYKEVIRGKAAYRTLKNGKVIRIAPDAGQKGKSKKGRLNLISDLNADFKASQNPTKRVSPVNLRLSGALHRSLFAETKGGFLRAYRLVIGFKNKLADIHNRLGAGKSKVIRRLLPTKNRETFNRRITLTIVTELEKARDKVVKQFNGR